MGCFNTWSGCTGDGTAGEVWESRGGRIWCFPLAPCQSGFPVRLSPVLSLTCGQPRGRILAGSENMEDLASEVDSSDGEDDRLRDVEEAPSRRRGRGQSPVEVVGIYGVPMTGDLKRAVQRAHIMLMELTESSCSMVNLQTKSAKGGVAGAVQRGRKSAPIVKYLSKPCNCGLHDEKVTYKVQLPSAGEKGMCTLLQFCRVWAVARGVRVRARMCALLSLKVSSSTRRSTVGCWGPVEAAPSVALCSGPTCLEKKSESPQQKLLMWSWWNKVGACGTRIVHAFFLAPTDCTRIWLCERAADAAGEGGVPVAEADSAGEDGVPVEQAGHAAVVEQGLCAAAGWGSGSGAAPALFFYCEAALMLSVLSRVLCGVVRTATFSDITYKVSTTDARLLGATSAEFTDTDCTIVWDLDPQDRSSVVLMEASSNARAVLADFDVEVLHKFPLSDARMSALGSLYSGELTLACRWHSVGVLQCCGTVTNRYTALAVLLQL